MCVYIVSEHFVSLQKPKSVTAASSVTLINPGRSRTRVLVGYACYALLANVRNCGIYICKFCEEFVK